MGNFSVLGLRLALYMLAALFVGLALREYARAWATARLGDPTPRLWGRITLRPKAWFDDAGGVREARSDRSGLPAADSQGRGPRLAGGALRLAGAHDRGGPPRE